MNTDRHISSWDKLSLKDKADIMKMAVQKGMYNLDAIRNTYNEFAMGGDKDGNTTPYTPYLNGTPMQAAIRQLNEDYSKPENRALAYNATHPVSPSNGGFVMNSDGSFSKVNPDPAINTMAEPVTEVASFMPVIGDAMYAGEVYDAAKQGNYGTAAALLGLAALPNALEKPVKKVLKYYKDVRNVQKSQRYLKNVEKEYNDAVEQIFSKYKDGEYPNQIDIDRINELQKLYDSKMSWEDADIKGLAYFSKDNSALGKMTSKFTKNYSDEELFNSPQDVIKQATKDYSNIKSGHTIALVDNGDLSKDSYPLLAKMAQRKTIKKEGEILPIIDDGTYRMVELNHYGRNPEGMKNIDSAISALREVTGDTNIPSRVSLFGHTYVPAFKFKKYLHGGPLVQLANKYDGETEPTQQMRIGRRPIISLDDGTAVPGYNYFGNQIWTMTDGNKAEDIDFEVGLPELTVNPQDNLDLAGVVNQGMNNAGNAVFNTADIVGSTISPLWGIASGITHGALAAKDIRDNGLNWNNGLEAAMGLGFTGFGIPRAYNTALQYASPKTLSKIRFYNNAVNDAVHHPSRMVRAIKDNRYIHDYSSLRRNVERAHNNLQKGNDFTRSQYYDLTGIDVPETSIRTVSNKPDDTTVAWYDADKNSIYSTITPRNSNISFYDNPTVRIGAHEGTHAAEEYLNTSTRLPKLTEFDWDTRYYVPNEQHPIASKYSKDFMKARKKHGKSPEETWANYMGAKSVDALDNFNAYNKLAETIEPPKGFIEDYENYLSNMYRPYSQYQHAPVAQIDIFP